MARIHEDVAPQLPASLFDPAGPWARWWLQPLLDAQRMQWDAWLSWQQSLATLNKDVWEQWAVRYGGGAPIDG
jgi:hypothetical protein